MNRPETKPDGGRRATASDVARAAGVSKWTVGRAFRSDASISQAGTRSHQSALAPESNAVLLKAYTDRHPDCLTQSLSIR